jgi:hypothetical protein
MTKTFDQIMHVSWQLMEAKFSCVFGRDFDAIARRDAAPTRGVFRGGPAGSLTESVRIQQDDGRTSSGEMAFTPTAQPVPTPKPNHADQ